MILLHTDQRLNTLESAVFRSLCCHMLWASPTAGLPFGCCLNRYLLDPRVSFLICCFIYALSFIWFLLSTCLMRLFVLRSITVISSELLSWYHVIEKHCIKMDRCAHLCCRRSLVWIASWPASDRKLCQPSGKWLYASTRKKVIGDKWQTSSFFLNENTQNTSNTK